MIIKVCGMRDSANIEEVERLGINMMGFIFFSKSPRFVKEIPSYLPDSCKRVGVFVNESDDMIIQTAFKYKLDFIQLHGNETPAQCAFLKEKGLDIIKVFSIKTDDSSDNNQFDINAMTAEYADCCSYFLFDTKCKEYGGSGKKFDWQQLNEYKGKTPFLLSGGITLSDAYEVRNFSHLSFAGVDINSGFEISPAFKDVENIKKFISIINHNK